MYIGNIVTKEKTTNERYNICDDINQINNIFPTLIVGWSKVKEIYGEDNVSIINKKISDNIYWTFTTKERKVDYEVDLLKFGDVCLRMLNKKIKYVYVDVIHYDRQKIKKILKKIYSLENIISLIEDNFIYIYDENLVFGIDLNILSFMGVNVEKIINKVNFLSKVTLEKNEIFNRCVRFVGNNNKKTIPFIYRYATTHKNNDTGFVCR